MSNVTTITAIGPILNLSTPSPTVIRSLNLVWNWTTLICQMVAFGLFSHLLVYAHCRGQHTLGARNLQPTMRLFLLFHSVCILTSIPASIYKVFLPLNPSELPRYLDFLFWAFALNSNYNLSISPFFVLFLTVERLLIIKFPLRFRRPHRKLYIWAVTVSAVLLYAASFAFFLAELPLDPKIALSSPPLIRIAPKFNFQPQSYFSTAFGVCNLLCCSLFLWLLWRNKELARKLKYRVVKFTVICELGFNVSRGIASILCTGLTGKTSSMYVGVLSNALMNVDTAVCAIFYTWIFLVVARREALLAASNPITSIHRLQLQMNVPGSLISRSAAHQSDGGIR